MNNDIQSLLAALQTMLSSGSIDQRATDTPANPMAQQIAGSAPRVTGSQLTMGQGRAMTEAERRARGMDPRDPNQYSILPDGRVVGTLIGWAGMGDRLTPEQVDQMWNERGNRASPMIPRATPNQYGMTRLSPGMYKDKSGNVVRSKTGAAPATKPTMKEMERAAAKGPSRVPKAG
jgi:hypothetical protein